MLVGECVRLQRSGLSRVWIFFALIGSGMVGMVEYDRGLFGGTGLDVS